MVALEDFLFFSLFAHEYLFSNANIVAGNLLYTPHKIYTFVRVLCRLVVVLKEVLALMGSQESSSLSLVA